MTGRAGTAKGVAVGQKKSFVMGRESEGGEGAGFSLARSWWMTGRAGTAKGVAVGATAIVKGRESEGGEGARFK